MGWKPGAAIGKTNKVAAEPIEFLARSDRRLLSPSLSVIPYFQTYSTPTLGSTSHPHLSFFLLWFIRGLGAEVGKPKRERKYIKPGESRKKEDMRVAPGADGRVRHFRTLDQKLIPLHSTRLRVNALVEVGLFGCLLCGVCVCVCVCVCVRVCSFRDSGYCFDV